MTDISTVYMGLKLKSPIIVGSCSLSKDISNIKAAQDAGAGALVIKSLFEEQIQTEAMQMEQELSCYADMIDEAMSFHPAFEHGGAEEHLMWIRKTRQKVTMPLIASLNAVSPGEWSNYAKLLEDAGVDAIELNLYSVITDFKVTDADVLKAMKATVEDVKSKVDIPVAAKLGPYFTSPGNAAKAMDDSRADALVIFNRFANFNIDADDESLKYDMVLSSPGEISHPLRWVSMLYGKVNADLCGSTGVHHADDVIKMILAGSNAVQVTSTLYTNGIDYIQTLNNGLAQWMQDKGYKSLADFQGKVSKARSADPFAYERAQYINILLGFD